MPSSVSSLPSVYRLRSADRNTPWISRTQIIGHSLAYDGLDRMVSTTLPGGGETRYAYDATTNPWANNGRNGVAYRAAVIEPAAQAKAS